MQSKTKEQLAQSLKKITENELFDDITVKRIVAESHVNRQTFYYHFQDKFDCLQYLFDSEAHSIVGHVTLDNWLDYYLKIFRYVDINKNFCYHIVGSQAYAEFGDFILEVIDLIIKRLVEQLKTEGEPAKIANSSALLLFEYGLQGIITNWFRDGLRENPELLVQGITAASQAQLQNLLGRRKSELIPLVQQTPKFV